MTQTKKLVKLMFRNGFVKLVTSMRPKYSGLVRPIIICLFLALVPTHANADGQLSSKIAEASTSTKSRKVVDASQYPWSAIGRINLSGRGHCTGSLIGERLVLTAAHCLYFRANRTWMKAKYIHFVAGFQRGKFQAHSIAERYVVSPNFNGEKWNAADNIPHDWALIILKEPIGQKVGFLGWQALEETQLKRLHKIEKNFILAGYPRDRAYVISIDDECRLDAIVTHLGTIKHYCRIVKGDSGGPIAISHNGKLSVIALNSAVFGKDGDIYNIAVSIKTFQRGIKAMLKLVGEDGKDRQALNLYGAPPKLHQ